MADEANLVVRVSNQGIQETTAALAGLKSQGTSTGDSFGNLALKIAGYSSALNIGISITRRALTELKDLGVQAVQLAGSFERSRVAWGVFLKDVEAGSQMFDRLYDVAQRTPLTFQGVESAAQMLKGFGLATEEIIPTLERMGDVARGNDETMQRLALAYGQALAQNRVLTRDLYQFVNAGVPIFEALSQVMGKTVQQVGILVSDGKVGFPEIEKALKALTDEGGQFQGMMERTAETFEGKLSIATDNWRAMLADLGENVLPMLKGVLDSFNRGADEAISKTNMLQVIAGKGGDLNSALAFAKRQAEKAPVFGVMENDATLGGWGETTRGEWEAYVEELQRLANARANSQRPVLPNPSNVASPVWGFYATDYQRYLRGAIPSDAGIEIKEGDILRGGSSGYSIIEGYANYLINQPKYSNLIGSSYEDEARKEFSKTMEDLQRGMLVSGIWKPGESTIQLITDLMNRYGYTKPKEEKPLTWSAPSGNSPADFWYKESLGIYENDPAYKSVEYYQNLGIKPPTDFWMPEIDAANEEAAQRYRQINNAAKYSAFGYGETYRAGFGLTGTLASLAAVTPRVKSGAADAYPVDLLSGERYTRAAMRMDAGGAWAWGNPEAQQAALDAAMNRRGADWRALYDPTGTARFAGRAQSDAYQRNEIYRQFFLKYGKTPDEVTDEINRNFNGSPEQAEYARNRYMTALGISQNASPYPLDPFWFFTGETPMNGGVISESNYPEMGYALTPPGIIAGENELPRYGTVQERDRARAERDAARYAAMNAYGQEKYAFTPESWRLNAGSFYDNGYLFPTEEENRKRLAGIEAENFITQTLLDSLDQSKLSLWDTETPRGRGSIYTNPSKLLELNMRAFERAAPSGRWQERPIAINAETGDISGYTVQQAYTDAEKYQEAQDNLTLALANGEISTEGYKQALKDLAEQYDPLTKAAVSFGDAIVDTAINTLADEMYNLGSALVSGADGWESFGDAMGNTLETLLQMLPKLAIQVGLSMLGNANPADDPLAYGLIAGGLVGQIGAGMAKANALGGVYESPSLHAYTNNVYNKPQMFAFANGGIFAEAGPEAIMPLSRDSSGRLGVKSSGGGSVGVQIINQTGVPITGKAKTITDASGNRKLVLTIKELVKQEVATANAGGVRKS